jgi:flagellar hook assembly protein FlgD
LPREENVTLKIYTLDGREVKTLIDGVRYSSGRYKVQWDGTDNFGNRVASGVYIYKLKAGNFEVSKKMLLLK